MTNTTEGAAYGAAILAAVGVSAGANVGVSAGTLDRVESACEQFIQVTDRTEPGRATVPAASTASTASTAVYEQIYPLYRHLYPALKQTFDAQHPPG